MNSNNEKEIRRFLNTLYTKEEAEMFFRDVKDPGNETAINNVISELQEEAELQKDTGDVAYRRYKQEARQLLKNLERKRLRLRPAVMYIAAMASAILLGIYLFQYVKNPRVPSVQYIEAATPPGEKKQLMFQDSTRVILNSRTNIAYPEHFGKNERRVKLSGEARFHVSKDKKPFIVETARFNIRVLGTAFNVKVYDEDETVSVTVNEGSVQVCMADASLTLKKNEKVTLNTRTGEIMKKITQNKNESCAWINGWLHFDRTPIRDVARELERMYGCRIAFKEGQEFNNLISGEHDNQSLESVLQSIQHTSGINYRKNENEILFYK